MPCARFDVALFDDGTFCDYLRITETDSLVGTEARTTWLGTTLPDSTTLDESLTETKLLFSVTDSSTLTDTYSTKISVVMPDSMLATDEISSLLRAAVEDALSFDDSAFDHLYESFIFYSALTKELDLWSKLTKELDVTSRLKG